jgi:flagellar motility protein MotE (MotC chaperone)
MSDATTAPEATPAPAAPIAATIPTPTASEPDWLPKRLEQAKRSATDEALKALGVDSLDTAKATIAKAKALEESQKSELQKLNERIAALEPSAKKAAELAEVVGKHADSELAKLSEEQRAAVLAIAGDDKARALATVEALRPTWVKAAPAAPPPPPAPANTAAATAAPTGGTVPTVNHKATWEALKATNPMYAAQYLRTHSADIFPTP